MAVVVFLAVIALLVVALWPGDEECERWQEEYRKLQAEMGDPNALLDYINIGPRSELEERRPQGCEIPK